MPVRKAYAYMRDPETGKRVLTHRWVAEQSLGRPLLPREVVHHKDGDSLNNDPTNLIVLPSQRVHAHAEFHLRRLRSGMPSLFPELFQVIPADTWGTLFAHVLLWQGQEPPPRQKPVRRPESPRVDVPLLLGESEVGERRLTLVISDTEAGAATLGEILGHIQVEVSEAASSKRLLLQQLR